MEESLEPETFSFFNKDYMKIDKFPSFWTKINKGINALIPEKNIILEGTFTTKSRYLGRNVSRYFKVSEDYLLFNKVKLFFFFSK